MTEIKVGDKVTDKMAGDHEYNVIGIDNGYAWIRNVNRGTTGLIVPLADLTKVEPFFEVGKTYQDVDGELFECKYVEELWGKRVALGIGYYEDDPDDPSDFYPSGRFRMGAWKEVSNG